jgi:two-component system, cell cycle sensor histidine kinase and response regulator CckA
MADCHSTCVILLVDDEPDVLAFTAHILSSKGYNVLTANNGMDAIEQSRGREATIALLLTDVVMDDLNGPNLAEYLLTINPALRVLFMSGWEPHVIAHEGAFRRGFRTVMKPFTPDGLLEAVQITLEESVPHRS